jgi:hypothetical protein
VALFSVIRLMRIARVTWIFFCVIRGLTFIGFVCVVKAIRVIITLSEYAPWSARHQVSHRDGGLRVT